MSRQAERLRHYMEREKEEPDKTIEAIADYLQYMIGVKNERSSDNRDDMPDSDHPGIDW